MLAVAIFAFFSRKKKEKLSPSSNDTSLTSKISQLKRNSTPTPLPAEQSRLNETSDKSLPLNCSDVKSINVQNDISKTITSNSPFDDHSSGDNSLTSLSLVSKITPVIYSASKLYSEDEQPFESTISLNYVEKRLLVDTVSENHSILPRQNNPRFQQLSLSPSARNFEDHYKDSIKDFSKAIEESKQNCLNENQACPHSKPSSDTAAAQKLSEEPACQHDALVCSSNHQSQTMGHSEYAEQGNWVKPIPISSDPSRDKGTKKVLLSWNATHAQNVQLCGSFNNWEQKLDLVKSDGSHFLNIYLPSGKHTYKFIVDGEWCYDFTLPNECDPSGNVNNIIVV